MRTLIGIWSPKWRKTLAAREEEEQAEKEEEEEAEDTMKVLICQDHLQAQGGERCVAPPGASANEQANIRLTKFHGKRSMLACLAGLRMNQSSQTRPRGRNLRVWSETLFSVPLPRCQ